MADTTQTQYPWRATARTVVAFLIAILPSVAAFLTDASQTTQSGALAAALPIVAGVTRFLALPGVNAALEQYLPFLSAAPASKVE